MSVTTSSSPYRSLDHLTSRTSSLLFTPNRFPGYAHVPPLIGDWQFPEQHSLFAPQFWPLATHGHVPVVLSHKAPLQQAPPVEGKHVCPC